MTHKFPELSRKFMNVLTTTSIGFKVSFSRLIFLSLCLSSYKIILCKKCKNDIFIPLKIRKDNCSISNLQRYKIFVILSKYI